MMRSFRFVMGLMTAFFGCQSALADGSGEWTVLFDGSDLSHWESIEGGEWKIEEDVLVGRNGRNWSTNPEQTGSYLRTGKMYRDFVLELEYAINERGNSGVMFRSAAEKNPSFTGYELQITDCFGREPNQKSMGIYDLIPPTENRARPANEWNQVRIEARGHHITVELNGKKVIDFTGDRRLEGYIGLQNHDERSVVKFRNIRIRETNTDETDS
ncbi:MAG: 3-keto-disaccharide hydrolase [bacterium]|jgi:hypothetical protein